MCSCAARHLVPARCPVLFLTHVATIPGGLALRANLEVFQKALDLAPVVDAIRTALQRLSAELGELVDCNVTPLPQPNIPRWSRHQAGRCAPP